MSTKDARSRVVQLDLSFDAKEHHGLDALNMIQHILEVGANYEETFGYCIARENILKFFPIDQSTHTANAGDTPSSLGVETIPA